MFIMPRTCKSYIESKLLSEEEKDFAEMLKNQGKKVENLFGQFWKAKPELLDNYSSNFFVCDFKNQNYFFLKDFCDKKQLELSSFA